LTRASTTSGIGSPPKSAAPVVCTANAPVRRRSATDAYFSLDRLAAFLRQAPLGLTLALNLDGGPVACQGVALNGFERRLYGRWEVKVENEKAQLLTWPYGTVAMPIVLAVFPR
jgi:hypothetical protein